MARYDKDLNNSKKKNSGDLYDEISRVGGGGGGGGSPGGSDTQVQYNDGGSFAGSANLTYDGTTLTASISGSTAEFGTLTVPGYPFDIRPRSTGIVDTNDAAITYFDSDTSSSFKINGFLYSPSNAVAVVTASSDYVTASVVSQSYTHNGQFSFTLSGSLGSAPADFTASIQIAVQSTDHPDDTPQTIIFRFGFLASSLSGCSLWLDANDASTITTYSCSPTGSAITGALAISDCQLWLDASDASTITLNGPTVSQWNDKSGNGNHAAQSTAGNQPIYNTNGWTHYETAATMNSVLFDGSNDLFENVVACNTTSRTIFVVFQSTGNQPAGLFHCNPTASNYYAGVFMPTYSSAPKTFLGASGGWRIDNVSSYWTSYNSSNWKNNLATIMLSPTKLSLRADSDDTWSSVASYTINTAGSLQIGAWTRNASDIREWQGNLAEMILYDRALDLDEQQRVENYLRDKWGTTPLGRVKQWTDKSGLGNNAASYAPSFSPSTSSTGINSKNTMNFKQEWANIMNLPYASVAISETPMHVFAVIKRVGTQGAHGTWLSIGGSHYDTFVGLYSNNKQNAYQNHGSSTSNYASTAIASTTTAYIMEFEQSGTIKNYYLDGVADGTYTVTPGGSWGVVSNNTRYVGGIVQNRTGNGYHSGHLAELIVCSASLSATERTDTIAYLKEKWGIT
jgi:hypothetical protein